MMKATINGITVEGTPQEIMEFQRMQVEREARKPYPNPYLPAPNPYTPVGTGGGWWSIYPPTTISGSVTFTNEPNDYKADAKKVMDIMMGKFDKMSFV